MISVLLASNAADGHVHPMLGVARGLVARGFGVRFLTGDHYAAAVEATGAEFIPLPPEATAAMETGTASSRASGITAINAALKSVFLDPAPAQFAALQAALAAEPADAVLAESTFVGASGLASLPKGERPVYVLCGILPLGLSSRDTAPFGLGVTPMRGPIGRVRNAALTWLAKKVILAEAHRDADVMLKQLGTPGLEGKFFLDMMRDVDILAQFTVPGFEYPRSDAPASLHFLGPTARLATSSAAMPEWWDELDPALPLVHVSQGTIGNLDFDELIAPTLLALADEPVQVVVATGGRPVSELPTLPANAWAAEFVPYDRLLPRTAVFVSNGGYGGLHYAMEHGVPLVVAGDTEDKLETTARVGWSGVGINLRTGHPKPAAIRKAVRAVLSDDRYRAASARIGAEIAASPGVDGLADLLEGKLKS